MNRRPPIPRLPIDEVRARRLFYFLGQMIWKGRNIFFILIANGIIGGLLIAFFDKKSVAESLYLSVITALTVGYGDLTPVSWSARIVAGAIGINGIIFTGVVIAFVVKALELTFAEDMEALRKQADSRDTDLDN